MAQVLSLGVLTGIQLLLSLLVQVIIVAALGAGTQTDCWVAAQAIPMMLLGVATIASQGAWQAEFSVAAREPESLACKQRTAHGQLLIAFGGVIVLFGATANLWAKWFFPGFLSDQSALIAELSVTLLAAAYLNAHSVLFTMAMRARQSFAAPEIVAATGGVLSIALTTLLIGKLGVFAPAWASLARSVFVVATLFILSGRAMPAVLSGVQNIGAWRRMRPLIISSTIARSAPLVDRVFGSLAPAGGLTTFGLALTGMAALSSVMDRALSTVPSAALGNLVKAGDFANIRRTYRQSLKRATWAAAATLFLLLAFLGFWPRLALLLMRLPEESALDLWRYCVLLTPFLIPASAGTTITFSFYALGDTATPARVATAGFLASILLKAAGFFLYGFVGIIVAILIHYLGNLVLLYWLLERRLQREERRVSSALAYEE